MKLAKPLRISIVALLITTAIGAIIAALFFTKQADYRDLKIAQFLIENETLPKGGVVFLGDSITDLYPLETGFPERTLINRGIGGDTTSGILERLDDTVIILEPTHLILLIGVNDLSLGRSVEAIAEDYETILDRLRSAFPDLILYVISVYPVNGLTYAPLELIADKIPQLNLLIAAMAPAYDATYIDLYPFLLDETTDRLKAEYADDGLHPNAEGYAVITAFLRETFDWNE
jgi:lysophospholipase L1-like esterase